MLPRRLLLCLSCAIIQLTFPALSAASLLIENVTLIDGTGKPPVSEAWVHVDGERITAVGRAGVRPPAATETIDAAGKFLIPGLVDMHIHLSGGPRGERSADREAGELALHGYLYSGVTSIYDAGNDPEYILSLREDERSGELVAPRIFSTIGTVTYPESHGSGGGATLVESWPEARKKLDEHIARKPDVLKLTYEERGWGSRPMIPKLPIDLLQHIVEYYNDHGIRTTVHVSGEPAARDAIFAGVDTLAHPVIVGPVSESFARLMGAKKIPMVTTLTIGERYSRLAKHPEYLEQPLYQAVLPAEEIERLQTEVSQEYADRSWTWWMEIMTPIAQENLRQIHEAGGVLVLGTDQSTGPDVHREMELLVDAGIPPLDVLRIATLNGAVFLGKAEELGSIEEGKLADMVLLEADPVADIDNAKRIDTVIKNGRIIDRSNLDLPVNQ
ncbi:MAG TPA: amidohydrolase family protein [Woeseiaceae bacterium]|nr:amidohydrolase family protein [Woeseiaceae bacterium]